MDDMLVAVDRRRRPFPGYQPLDDRTNPEGDQRCKQAVHEHLLMPDEVDPGEVQEIQDQRVDGPGLSGSGVSEDQKYFCEKNSSPWLDR